MKSLRHIPTRLFAAVGRMPAKKIDLAIAALVTAVGLAVFGFVGLGENRAAAFGFLQNIELRSLDARFNLRGAREHDHRIVIVGMDEKTLQRAGSFPIPRNAYARAVEQINKGGAKIIAFDVAFPTPEKNSAVEALARLEKEAGGRLSPAMLERVRQIERESNNDLILAKALKDAGNVILGHLFLSRELAQSIDQKAAEQYLNIASLQAFPQVIKTERSDFDLGGAWEQAGGNVAFGVESNILLLAENALSYGFFDKNLDNDGTIRRALMMIRYGDQDFFPSLSLEAVRRFEQIKDEDVAAYINENGLERIELGPHTLRTRGDGTALINYTGPYGTYQHYSMADVLDGTVPPDAFKDNLVLLGATAKAIGDLRTTPFVRDDTAYMGVEIHANTIDNILHSGESGRGFLKRGFDQEMVDIGFILTFGLALGYLFGRVKPMISTLLAAASLAGFGFIVFAAFKYSGAWLSFVIPAGVLVTNYAAITSFRMIFEEREKRKIRRTFQQYVSPGVIALIEKDPQRYFRPGGETKELTVMFSDIRDFTTISEGMTADELVSLLNEYLGEMTDILFRRWGTLDKYIGDAIMGFWGSPYPQDDHAVRACACALDMSKHLDAMNQKWEAQGKRQLSIGIGLNTGLMNVGNMGSSKRLSWTVMGDNVNLGSRLEGTTKKYGVRTIVSEATWRLAKEHYVFRELDKIRVKGKLQPVSIFELMNYANEAGRYQDLIERWERAVSAYRSQQWSQAIAKLNDILDRYPHDGPAHVFLKRAYEFSIEAPEGAWDGVYVSKEK